VSGEALAKSELVEGYELNKVIMNKMMYNRIGTHIRMRSSLQELIQRADFLNLPFFQCFFVPQESGRLIHPTTQEIQEFLRVRRAHFSDLFCHISYWVNLSSLSVSNGFIQLRREIICAKRLEFTHFVLHAGTAKGALNRLQGVDALAKALNHLFRLEKSIIILLENSCHGNLTVGSDVTDFKLLLEKIDDPTRIQFCIDTAHAHSFGYDIAEIPQQEKFIQLLQETIGLERIKLIHLNDTLEKLGSRIDRHAVIGDGYIGQAALQHFAMHPQLQHIPLLLELPELSMEEELIVVNKVREW
jgi:deoxyribonuclease IV